MTGVGGGRGQLWKEGSHGRKAVWEGRRKASSLLNSEIQDAEDACNGDEWLFELFAVQGARKQSIEAMI